MELTSSLARIADRTGTEPLREALAASVAMCADPGLRAEYDRLRADLDAFLRARVVGEAAVDPSTVTPSPPVSEEQMRLLTAALVRGRCDDR